MIETIISGGQTGVDQAALAIAIELAIPYGGYCPKGRIAENGVIPEEYKNLTETQSEDCAVRTKLNVIHSDGTLILLSKAMTALSDGTPLTAQIAEKQHKPCLIIDLSLDCNVNISQLTHWMSDHNIKVLNIAGPRESQNSGINQLSQQFLRQALPTLVSSMDVPSSNNVPGL